MSTKTSTPADLDITATTPKGNTYKVAIYVDPFPGRRGDERVSEDCGWCGGTGVYDAPSGHEFHTATVGAVTTGCFKCWGTGKHSRLVSSARSTARKQVKAENARRAEAADWEAGRAAREAAELEEAHTEALAEEARRAAKPKGFVGQVGERLRNLDATVTLIRVFETTDHFGRPDSKVIVKFDVEGKAAVWFTSYVEDLEEGQTVKLTGTVKSHGDRDGEEQTILTRCKIS